MASISEEKRGKIEKEAREILKKFSSALAKVKIPKMEAKKEVGGFREEREGKKGDEEFKRRMFANAPEKDGDYIIAEKKTW